MRLLTKILKWYDVTISNSQDTFLLAGNNDQFALQLDEKYNKAYLDKPIVKNFEGEREKIVKKAQNDAKNIIEKANKEAQKILEQAKITAEEELQNAKNCGYEAGLKLGREKISQENQDVMSEIVSLLRTIKEQKDEILKTHEMKIKDLAINIARKIIRTELDTRSSTFLNIYKNAVQDLRHQEWIKVTVSGYEVEFATSNSKMLLSMVKGAKHIEIETLEEAPRGTCIIETTQGIIDASIETQLKTLQEAFVEAEFAV